MLHNFLKNNLEGAAKMNNKNPLSPKLNSLTPGESFYAIFGENLGNQTLAIQMSINDFIKKTEVFNKTYINDKNLTGSLDFEAQRVFIPSHSQEMGLFVLKGLLQREINNLKLENKKIPAALKQMQEETGEQPYAAFQPFVLNIRGCDPNGDDLNATYLQEHKSNSTNGEPNSHLVKIWIRSHHRLAVVDGQHRRECFIIFKDWLTEIERTDRFPKKGLYIPSNVKSTDRISLVAPEMKEILKKLYDEGLTQSFLKAEAHLGLDEEKERQLFADYNLRGKRPPISVSQEYDRSDPVNNYVKDDLIAKNILKMNIVNKEIKDWSKDEGQLVRKDLNSVTSFVLFGKANNKKATPLSVNKKKSEATKFWEVIQKIPNFGQKRSKQKTVAAQTVVQKALARLIWELREDYVKHNSKDLSILYKAIVDGDIDFSHENLNWSALMYDDNDRKKLFPGIEKYVYVAPGTNLDAGTYDQENKWTRYGNRHNDILKRIGDIIRFELKLPPRKQKGLN